MILVNSPGNKTAYWPFEHADWHGLTPTDLVFPFFMIIVGMSLVLSLQRRLGTHWAVGVTARDSFEEFGHSRSWGFAMTINW